MRRTHRANIELINTVAKRLGPLLDRVVFLGGAATGLLITDTAAPDVRPTLDVDVVVEISSRASLLLASIGRDVINITNHLIF